MRELVADADAGDGPARLRGDAALGDPRGRVAALPARGGARLRRRTATPGDLRMSDEPERRERAGGGARTPPAGRQAVVELVRAAPGLARIAVPRAGAAPPARRAPTPTPPRGWSRRVLGEATAELSRRPARTWSVRPRPDRGRPGPRRERALPRGLAREPPRRPEDRDRRTCAAAAPELLDGPPTSGSTTTPTRRTGGSSTTWPPTRPASCSCWREGTAADGRRPQPGCRLVSSELLAPG